MTSDDEEDLRQKYAKPEADRFWTGPPLIQVDRMKISLMRGSRCEHLEGSVNDKADQKVLSF